MPRTILSLMLVSLMVFSGSTQTTRRSYSTCAYGEIDSGLERCKNLQADLAYSEPQAGTAVDRILRKIGMGARGKIALISCPGIEGALAGIDESGNRIIWYDNNFMAELNRRANADSPS